MVYGIVFVLVIAGAWFLGVWGFPQIIGSIAFAHRRKWYMTIWTITLWLAILGFAAFVVHAWLPKYTIPYYIGTAISFFMSFRVLTDEQ